MIKTTKRLSLFLIAGILFYSCNSESDPISDNDRTESFRTVTLTASTEDISSKVAFQDDIYFGWQSQDEIAVFTVDSDGGNGRFTRALFTGTPGASSGSFEMTLPEGRDYFFVACYPYSAGAGYAVSGGNEGVVTFRLPQEYLLSDDDSEAPMPMVAWIDNDNPGALAFKSVGALVKVTLKDVPSVAKHFRLTCNKAICGDFELPRNTAVESPSVLVAKDGNGYVQVSVPEGKRRESISLYFPVPTGEAMRFGLEVYGDDGVPVFIMPVGNSEHTILRKEILKMPEITISNTRDVLSGDEMWTIEDFPWHIKKNLCLTLQADITGEGSFLFGKGFERYRGDYVRVSPSEITHIHYDGGAKEKSSIQHGMTLSGDVIISLSSDTFGGLDVRLSANGESKTMRFTDWGNEANYELFVRSEGAVLENMYVTATSRDIRYPLWVIGDSYLGFASSRWPGVLRDQGYTSYLVDGLPGQGSYGALLELRRLLRLGTPDILFWTLGMNDPSEDNYKFNLGYVEALCAEKGITLVLATIPTVPGRDKEGITAFVRSSGYRYVDFYAAVEADATGTWKEGYLSSDNVHPTAAGAQAMATRILDDLPEIVTSGGYLH